MNRKEIEWGFIDAGWELDGGFSGYLIIGENGDQSILAHQWAWGTEDPVFELSSRHRDLAYWVRESPTPQRAGELLEEHGGPPEEEQGNPYKQGE